MEQYYLVLLAFLGVIAVIDLFVGVSNDAVNFLNSALGCRISSFRTTLWVASIGVLAGATFSSGMMEIARSGVFHPQLFTFSELMIVFFAVMVADVILLDAFNSLGLPTSTTVSIVFELMGAAFAAALFKLIDAGAPLSDVADYINSSKSLGIVSGILISVVVAFISGAVVQYLARLVFTFKFEKAYRRIGAIYGGIALTDARVSEGAVPLVMKPSNIRIDFAGDTSTLEGRLETSQGALDLAGDAQWRDMAHPTANVHASGSDILITVPPYAKVTVSPDVSLAASSERVTLNGRIEVPAAQITVADLPATATGVSSDEVLLDRHMKPKVSKTATIPIDSNIVVHMGDQIFIDAFGLKAKLSGDLKVTQDARRGLGLNGQVNVDDGRFHAYGQDLIVRTGHVIFAGPPSRPQLNIEAIRNPEAIEDDVTAGIRVTGNAMRPKVTVFSEPALSQQQTLSYLLRGQGLDTSSDDNSMITSALVGLGVSQTGRIIGEIGDAVGIKDLGVDTAGVGESSQVVVSGYILPGLQLKYGVGIFDSLATITLRYRLMPRLYLEAASGVNQAFDVLYSFEY